MRCMPPTEPPADIAEHFERERAQLLELLVGLDRQSFEEASPCPGWTVLDVCRHLLGDDFGLLARHRDRHHGTRPPSGLQERDFATWLDDLQVRWVDAARRLSRELVVDLLAWTGPQLVALMRSQDPFALSAHVGWAGPSPVPIWLDQVRELSEYWIHRQQILLALGRPSELETEVLRVMFEGFRWAYPFRLEDIVRAPGDTVTIDVVGPFTATWHLVTSTSGWEFRSERDGREIAHVRLATDQAWRLLTNNMPPLEQDRLDLTGDEQVIDVLRNTRAIIGVPK
jgi:uncharacterized protein (TIGR03083 family)